MRDLKRSEEGVMDYPFRLLIIMIVLGIAIPSMLSALSYYRTRSAEEQLSQEAEQIASAVESVFIQGENASVSLDVELPDETEYMRIGGPLSDSVDTRAIYYKIQGESEDSILVSYGRKSIPMSSPDNTTFLIRDGTHELFIVKRAAGFDLSGDGIVGNDYYVEIGFKR